MVLSKILLFLIVKTFLIFMCFKIFLKVKLINKASGRSSKKIFLKPSYEYSKKLNPSIVNKSDKYFLLLRNDNSNFFF